MRDQFLSETPQRRLVQLAAQFGRITASIEARQPDRIVTDEMRTTQALCAAAAPGAPSAETSTLLTNVQTALETWRTVWPRMSGRAEFRRAVTRETALWAKKFQALALRQAQGERPERSRRTLAKDS